MMRENRKDKEARARKDREARATARLQRINALVSKGILSRELCPELDYWHWQILKPDDLPEEFSHFKELGEVRF